MRELTQQEFKEIEIDILKNFDRFCKKNGIRYSLGEGTLIGAIRHKGFIPWDDDIDVIMLREDFERFKKLYTDDRFELVYTKEKGVFPFFYMRLADTKTVVDFPNIDPYFEGGVWIDILPIDNIPDSDEELREREKQLARLFRIYRTKTRKGWNNKTRFVKNLAYVFIKAITFPISTKWLRGQIEKIMTSDNDKQTNSKSFLTNYYHHPYRFPSHVFDGDVLVEFEGDKYPAIAGYDEYLRCEYGNYMELPPVEKRIAHHGFDVYWKE